jgi:hypothetical protein
MVPRIVYALVLRLSDGKYAIYIGKGTGDKTVKRSLKAAQRLVDELNGVFTRRWDVDELHKLPGACERVLQHLREAHRTTHAALVCDVGFGPGAELIAALPVAAFAALDEALDFAPLLVEGLVATGEYVATTSLRMCEPEALPAAGGQPPAGLVPLQTWMCRLAVGLSTEAAQSARGHEAGASRSALETSCPSQGTVRRRRPGLAVRRRQRRLRLAVLHGCCRAPT